MFELDVVHRVPFDHRGSVSLCLILPSDLPQPSQLLDCNVQLLKQNKVKTFTSKTCSRRKNWHLWSGGLYIQVVCRLSFKNFFFTDDVLQAPLLLVHDSRRNSNQGTKDTCGLYIPVQVIA